MTNPVGGTGGASAVTPATATATSSLDRSD